MSVSAPIADLDFEAEDLPPHRAAIPVSPEALGSDHHLRRRNLVRMAVVFSLALHVGFFLAAMIWGQGRPFMDGHAGPVRAHLAQASESETVIEKAAPPAMQQPDPVTRPADPALIEPAPAPLYPPIEVRQPSLVELTAHLENRLDGAAELLKRREDSPAPPPSSQVESDTLPAAAPPRAEQTISAPAGEQDAPSNAATEPAIVTPEAAQPRLQANKLTDPRKKSEESATSAVSGGDRPRAPASTERRSGSLFSYRRRVRGQVMRNLPEGRWGAGRVIVGFRVSRSGELLAASVARSSGNRAMDEAALASVRSSGPFPAPPRGGAPGDVALSLDFRFQ